MASKHQRNVSGMHDAPRCQTRTKAGEMCRKPAVKGKTRCESHGGKGADSRNYPQQARNQKDGFQALQWQVNLEVRELEKTMRKLRRKGAPTEVLEDLAKRRWGLLRLTGQDADELASQLVPVGFQPDFEEEAAVAFDCPARELSPDHPLRHLNRGRARGAMLGLAIGEAVGITLLGQRSGTFIPIEDMRGGGRLGLKPGQWAGDTAMAARAHGEPHLPARVR